MKRYIAFHNSMNSGVKTREGALQWASELLGQGKVGKVYLTEITDVVERTAPPIAVKPYLAAEDTEDNTVAKAA